MIRFAKDEDQAQLKALWQVAFGDSSAAVNFYFSNRHQNENMLVAEVDGHIAAMLTMLPVQLAFGTDMRRGRYVYAVATARQYRGQGISSELLTYCHDYMQKNCEAASVLVPASDHLFEFYGKRGYKTDFFVENFTLHAKDLPSCPQGAVCTPCSSADFFRLRNAAFSEHSIFVQWDEDALGYIIKSNAAFGDGVYHIRTAFGEGCAVCGWRGRKIFIREIAVLNIDLPTAVSILHQTLGAEEYSLRLPAGSIKGSVPQPFGMIHYLGDIPELHGKSPYLSLVLD